MPDLPIDVQHQYMSAILSELMSEIYEGMTFIEVSVAVPATDDSYAVKLNSDAPFAIPIPDALGEVIGRLVAEHRRMQTGLSGFVFRASADTEQKWSGAGQYHYNHQAVREAARGRE